jgi:hypothetical protein
MLVDLLLTRSNDQVRALIHPDRGCPAVELAGGPPSYNTIREVGAEAQQTRFAVTPPQGRLQKFGAQERRQIEALKFIQVF